MNLGHSYLQSNSSDNSEDEYEKESGEMESQLNITNKRTVEFQEEQINVFENIESKIIEETSISSNNNKQNETKKDTEINLDLKITVDPDFQNELNATMQGFKKKKQIHEENIEVELNIEVLDDLDSQSKSNDNVQIQHDIDTTPELDAINQVEIELTKKFDEEIEQEIKEIVDTMYNEPSQVIDKVLNNMSKEIQMAIQKKVLSDINEINNDLQQLDDDSYKEIETLVEEGLHKLYPFTKQEKYLENTFVSLHEKSAPFDERVEKLCNLYFPTMNQIHQDNTNNEDLEIEKDMQKRHNLELVQELNKIDDNINADMIQIDENWIHLINNTNDDNVKETQRKLSNPIDIMKKALENFEINKNHTNIDKTQQKIEDVHNNCDDIIIDKVCQRFDIVIQLNKEIQQNVDGQSQIDIKENIQINLNEKMKKCCNKTQNIEGKIQNEVVEEMEVDSDGDIQMEIIKSTHLDNKMQDKDNTSILMQLEFYKHIQENQNELSEYFRTNRDIFKRELLNKAKESDEFDIEIQDSDVDIENSDNEVQFEIETQSAGKLNIEEIDKNTQKDLRVDIINHDCEIELESEIEIEVNDDNTEVENTKFDRDVSEDFDLNILDFDSKIHFEFEVKPEEFDKTVKQTIKSSLENIETKKHKNENINEQQIVEDLHEFEEKKFFREVNEVVEVVEDIEIKSHFVSDEFTSTEKEFIFTEEEYISTDDESSVTEEFLFIEEEVNCTKREFEGEYSSTDEELSEMFKQMSEDFEVESNKNMQTIPKKLQIKQKQNLNQQLKEFQTEFYSNLKQEYENEMPSKTNKQFNLVTSPIFNEQQQTFYELKDEFKEIKQEYKSFIHEKWLNDLQNMDNTKLFENGNYSKKHDNKPNFKTDNMYEELINFQHDFSKIEPEFKCNVPIYYKEEIKPLQQKPFNLFKKLHSIHNEKLCSFVDAKQWPENVSKDNVTC